MTRKCEVPNCKGIGAHKFPRDPAIKKLWVKAIKRDNFVPQDKSRICRSHFLESDYQNISIYTGTVNLHRYLKKAAVPSVFARSKKRLPSKARARDERQKNNKAEVSFHREARARNEQHKASKLKTTCEAITYPNVIYIICNQCENCDCTKK